MQQGMLRIEVCLAAFKYRESRTEYSPKKYPTITKSWRDRWTDIITLFDFPWAVRKVISTTNTIESVNSVIRKLTRNRKIYPSDDSAIKNIYIAIMEASKKWTMPIAKWKSALNHFAIMLADRMPEQLPRIN